MTSYVSFHTTCQLISVLLTTSSETEAMDALRTLQEHDIGRLLVVEDGELVGLVSRTERR
ncbi:hypothetical protein BRD19_09115 [Halobacteriales archaeon SW_7_65_23]|nr:MAG: hypothetical protein BRD19_09115 [Halobacteriales archaeon SW_7_65_23]